MSATGDSGQGGNRGVRSDSPAEGSLSQPQILRVRRALELDLPLQYDLDMDWSVYDDSVGFADPVSLFEGKLVYRGMIGTLRLVAMAAFEPGTAKFELYSVEEVPPTASTTSPYPAQPDLEARQSEAVAALRTTWRTLGRTRWGKDLIISGDDIFRINSKGLIITHESAWNESPSEVWNSFRL